MKNSKFFKGAIILIVCNLIGKVLGAVYRIPLAGIVGSEGVGQYQLIFPFYCLILTISSSGIPVAISKLVAEYNSENNFANSRKLLKISIIILTIISSFLAIFVALSAKLISSIQGNPEIYICYYAITPAILFVGILSALRGYFQGNLIMYPTAISGLIEQIVKLFAGLFFAKKLLIYGVEYAVFGAILGISLSEFIACLFLVVCYMKYSKKYKEFTKNNILLAKDLSKRLISVSVPITFGGLIGPITAMIDSLLVVNLLMFNGFSSGTSTMMLGLQSGVVEPLVNIPVVIAISISSVILPSISELMGKNKKDEINELILKSLKMGLSIAVTCFICFIIFGRQALMFLYGGNFGGYEISIAVKLLFLGATNIIFLSIVQISSGVLQGLGFQKYPVFSLIIGCLIKIIFDVILILMPTINIYGTVLSAGISYLFILTLNLSKIKKITSIKYSSIIGEIIIQQAFVCSVAYFGNKILIPLIGEIYSLFFAGALTGIVFLIGFFVLFSNIKSRFENKRIFNKS